MLIMSCPIDYVEKSKNKNPYEPAAFGVHSRKTKKQRVFE